MHHEQDMRYMGGLRKYMPRTFLTFFIATLAIAGVPGPGRLLLEGRDSLESVPARPSSVGASASSPPA
jgi:NADH:ubiquinone oxidoreductase subunit 5 (subunit L)/multisubunit Na+/H+ antiporter MnhA subunit